MNKETKFKKYCDENGLKLQKFVENLILKNIKDGKSTDK
jgi:hypothetical protein